MAGLPNLGSHSNAVDMAETAQREIRSNARDDILERSINISTNATVTSGTNILTDEQRLATGLVRLIGSPGAGFTVQLADGDRRISFENATGQTATIDTVTGAASTIAILDTETRVVHVNSIDLVTEGLIGIQAGALLHSGQVNPTSTFNWADFEIARAEFKDYGFTTTNPTISAGNLSLDMENGNYFKVLLTANVASLSLLNPPASGTSGTIVFVAGQDSGGSNAITWPSNVIWERNTGTSPDQTVTTSATDIYMFTTVDAGTGWYGFLLGLNMS